MGVDKLALVKRLTREARWNAATIRERDDLMSHARRELGLAKQQAQEWTYSELERRYPPLNPKEEPGAGNRESGPAQENPGNLGVREDSPTKTDRNKTKVQTSVKGEEKKGQAVAATGDGEGEGDAKKSRPPKRPTPPMVGDSSDRVVVGLDRVPRSWGPLPANASLAAEIQWVQSNRIDIVQERGSAVLVRLSRAAAPAPSKAALGWLETSIRAYSKYCDIAAKAAAAVQDEQATVRRERMQIDRIRQLLGEMVGE